MPTIEPRTTSPSTSELPDVLQFMQALWAVAHELERTSKRRQGERVNALGGGTAEAAVTRALADLNARDQAATRRVLQRIARHLVPDTLAQPGVVQRRRRVPGQPMRGRGE